MPETSADHRTMPVLAWRAIEALLREPVVQRDVAPQQELLQAAMDAYQVSLHDLAAMLGVRPLTMDNWMRSDELRSHRGMPALARAALEQLLVDHHNAAKPRTKKRPPKAA
jgi:hypothetical protein